MCNCLPFLDFFLLLARDFFFLLFWLYASTVLVKIGYVCGSKRKFIIIFNKPDKKGSTAFSHGAFQFRYPTEL